MPRCLSSSSSLPAMITWGPGLVSMRVAWAPGLMGPIVAWVPLLLRHRPRPRCCYVPVFCGRVSLRLHVTKTQQDTRCRLGKAIDAWEAIPASEAYLASQLGDTAVDLLRLYLNLDGHGGGSSSFARCLQPPQEQHFVFKQNSQSTSSVN